jgi:UDP-N-acetylglucosamine 4,6-dehydratase/UDP-glucose 4-epimerase
MIIKDKIFVVTGGYGFLGSHLIADIIDNGGIVKAIGRDVKKMLALKDLYGDSIEIFLGDIKNINDVTPLITEEVTGVFHLAAFKYVGAAEERVLDCISTNIIGTINVLETSAKCGVEFVMGVTGAAAVQVSGTYGATKMLNEKLFFYYQKEYSGTKFRILRYGNILYSTGSVLCKWKNLISRGEPITITDGGATRFFSTIEEAVQLIYDCIDKSQDFRPYIPQLKAITIDALLMAMILKYKPANTEVKINRIGMQVGENKHEKVHEHGANSSECEQFTLEEILKII